MQRGQREGLGNERWSPAGKIIGIAEVLRDSKNLGSAHNRNEPGSGFSYDLPIRAHSGQRPWLLPWRDPGWRTSPAVWTLGPTKL